MRLQFPIFHQQRLLNKPLKRIEEYKQIQYSEGSNDRDICLLVYERVNSPHNIRRGVTLIRQREIQLFWTETQSLRLVILSTSSEKRKKQRIVAR